MMDADLHEGHADTADAAWGDHPHEPPNGMGDAASAEAATDELPRLAFVHIPKTAGTSVTTALVRHYGGQTLPAMTTLDYRAYADGGLAGFRLYKGHAYRADYLRLPPDTRRFTVLRHPVSRALSYYSYCRGLDAGLVADPFVREAAQLARVLSPVEFVYSDSPSVIEHIRLGQVRQFLPAASLAEVGHRARLTVELRRRVLSEFVAEMRGFAYVMTVECLALSFGQMAAELGLPRDLGLPHENASVPTEWADRTDLLRALIDVNAVEFECYAQVQARELAWLAARLRPRTPGRLPVRSKRKDADHG